MTQNLANSDYKAHTIYLQIIEPHTYNIQQNILDSLRTVYKGLSLYKLNLLTNRRALQNAYLSPACAMRTKERGARAHSKWHQCSNRKTCQNKSV